MVAREMGMEERRGEQAKGGEESGVKLSGRRELREGKIQKIYSKSPFFKRNKSQHYDQRYIENCDHSAIKLCKLRNFVMLQCYLRPPGG